MIHENGKAQIRIYAIKWIEFLDTETQKTPCLINFGYTGKNYTLRLFHPVRLLKFWYFSTLCVYLVLYIY